MSRKKSLRKIDFVRYQEQNAFEVRLRACIVAIAKWKSTSTYYENEFYRLLGQVKPRSVEDIGRLPYQGHDFRTKNIQPELRLRLHHKYECLLATSAFIVLQWWLYCNMLVSSGRLNHMINYLENIVDKGLDVFNVVGNVRKGWRLHEK